MCFLHGPFRGVILKAFVATINILYVLATDLLLQNVALLNDRPVLSSERAPHMDRTVTVKQELISGHEAQMGIDTETD
jgi:hypothetical protein